MNKDDLNKQAMKHLLITSVMEFSVTVIALVYIIYTAADFAARQ